MLSSTLFGLLTNGTNNQNQNLFPNLRHRSHHFLISVFPDSSLFQIAFLLDLYRRRATAYTNHIRMGGLYPVYCDCVAVRRHHHCCRHYHRHFCFFRSSKNSCFCSNLYLHHPAFYHRKNHLWFARGPPSQAIFHEYPSGTYVVAIYNCNGHFFDCLKERQ